LGDDYCADAFYANAVQQIAMSSVKPKLRNVSPDDPRLRTEFIALKFINGTLLLLWLSALITLWVMYGSLPLFVKLILGAAIWIFSPDIKGVKLLFSNFEVYRRSFETEQVIK
jgi:hypothetical protein